MRESERETSSSLAARLHRESVKARVFGRAPGARLDRYVVLGKLGEGGTGSVFAAYDPTLDRKVAIKLLRCAAPASADDPTPSWFAALEREARAMARLSHPNVVHVYEVGERDGQRYLVMELVQGSTLRGRVREALERVSLSRALREVVDLHVQAGHGLAAAHRAGLLHRDFKPDNVLVDAEGRVKVCDFGLARGVDVGVLPTRPDPRTHAADAVDGAPTTSQALAGTPLYMAPELLRGEAATARSDQFSFCVSLYEALEGARPFEGNTQLEVFVNVLGGKLRAPTRGRPVPAWLRRACARGLALDPLQRWPTMDALLETLARGRARAHLRKGLVAVGLLAALTAARQGYRHHDLAQRAAACQASGDEVDAAWNDARRQALRDALIATGFGHAAATADRVMPWLDRQAAAWRAARVETCLDAQVRDRWDPETDERSRWCLDQRRTDLHSLVEALMDADVTVLNGAVPAAASLAPVAPCRDEAALRALDLPPPADRAAIASVSAEVTRAGTLERAGRYPRGLELARAALERAEALRWRPLAAAARLRHGSLLERTGDLEAAEATLETAYFAAGDAVAPELLVEAATVLVNVVGQRARHDEARRWGRHAELALAGVRDGEHLARARLLGELAVVDTASGAHEPASDRLERALAIEEQALGPAHPHVALTLTRLATLRRTTGAYAEAMALLERALAIDEQALGPGHPTIASTLTSLANVHFITGAHDQARAAHQRARAILEHALGPEHPDVARSLANLANLHMATGAHVQAEAAYRRALTILERSLGPEHPDVARCLNQLGIALQISGAADRARPLHERALAIDERILGPEHHEVAASLTNLAHAYDAAGDRNQALAAHERALAITEKSLGPEHPTVATSLHNLAELHAAAGDHDRATARHARALAIWEQSLGREHPDVAYALLGLAEAALARRRPGDALPLAERAVAVREQGDVSPDLLFEARLVLVRALWAAPTDGGRDRDRARTLARRTRDESQAVGASAAAELAASERWLSEHPGERGPGDPRDHGTVSAADGR